MKTREEFIEKALIRAQSKLKITNKPDGSFLSGSKWQSINEIKNKRLFKILEDFNEGKDIEPKNLEFAIEALAIQIIKYSDSEWGNDYIESVLALAQLATLIPMLEELGYFNPVQLVTK